MNFINNDSAVGRSIRTIVQVIIAIVVAVVQVPGVPEAVYKVLQDYSGITVPAIAGVVAFVWNFFRKDVKNI